MLENLRAHKLSSKVLRISAFDLHVLAKCWNASYDRPYDSGCQRLIRNVRSKSNSDHLFGSLHQDGPLEMLSYKYIYIYIYQYIPYICIYYLIHNTYIYIYIYIYIHVHIHIYIYIYIYIVFRIYRKAFKLETCSNWTWLPEVCSS